MYARETKELTKELDRWTDEETRSREKVDGYLRERKVGGGWYREVKTAISSNREFPAGCYSHHCCPFS